MPPLLTQRDLAALLSLSTRTLERLRTDGGGPRFVRVSRSAVRYRLEDVERWCVSRIHGSTSEPNGESK